ncbi:MAG: S-layer homology domain-containing protein [Clostridia bacterium]|nr:S-layer homology domain-containing protein [Clostridia bacterium]
MSKPNGRYRALSLLLAFVTALTLFVALPQTVAAADKTVQYADSAFISAYAADAVDTVRSYNVMHGSVVDGDYVFRPLDYITRQEMFRVVYALGNAGKTERSDLYEMVIDFSAFTDKNQIAAWAKSYAGYCIGMGLFIGDGANHLNPNDPITYLECAIVFLRMLGYSQTTLSVQADETVGAWRKRVISEADRLGLFDGVLYYENGRYDQAIFRQDVAVMVANALQCKVVTYYLVREEVVYVESSETLAQHNFGTRTTDRARIIGMTKDSYLLENGIRIAPADFRGTDKQLLGRTILYQAASANPFLSWDGSLAPGETVTTVAAVGLQGTIKNHRLELKVDNTAASYVMNEADYVCVFDGDDLSHSEMLTMEALLERLTVWRTGTTQVMLRVVVGENKTLQSILVVPLG